MSFVKHDKGLTLMMMKQSGFGYIFHLVKAVWLLMLVVALVVRVTLYIFPFVKRDEGDDDESWT